MITNKQTNPLKYADIFPVACNILSIIPHVVRVDARYSLGGDVIAWRQSNTRETLSEQVVVMQFARVYSGVLAGDEPSLHTMNTEHDLELRREAEKLRLHRKAKVHDLLEMLQGSRNLCAMEKESRAQINTMTTVGYISDMDEIIKVSWSLFQDDGAAAFPLSERSPLPPATSVEDLHG